MTWLRNIFRRRPPKRFASILGVRVLAMGINDSTRKGGLYGL